MEFHKNYEFTFLSKMVFFQGVINIHYLLILLDMVKKGESEIEREKERERERKRMWERDRDRERERVRECWEREKVGCGDL